MVTSALMTDTSREVILKRVLCIRYPVQFCRKNYEDEDKDVRALIDSSSEFNAMHPAYATKLDLRIKKIDVGTQKIDGSHLDNFEMVIADCSVRTSSEGFDSSRRPFC